MCRPRPCTGCTRPGCVTSSMNADMCSACPLVTDRAIREEETTYERHLPQLRTTSCQPQETRLRRCRSPGGGRDGRAAPARHRARRNGPHQQRDRYAQRLLLLLLDRHPGFRQHDAVGHGRFVQQPVEQREQLGRRTRLEQRQPPGRHLLRIVQPGQQRLPRAVRVDGQPAGRVLHRGELRPVQPRFRRHEARHGHRRRRYVRHLRVHPDQPALRGRHQDLPAVLEHPAEQAQQRHHQHRRALRRLAGGRDADGCVQLLHDHGHGGLPEHRQLQRQPGWRRDHAHHSAHRRGNHSSCRDGRLHRDLPHHQLVERRLQR